MHSLVPNTNNPGKWDVIFDNGSGKYVVLATVEPIEQAVRLVNYLNGGTGAESGFPFQQTTGAMHRDMPDDATTLERLRTVLREPIR